MKLNARWVIIVIFVLPALVVSADSSSARERPISVVVKEGHPSSEFLLPGLPGGPPRDAWLEITQGPGRFMDTPSRQRLAQFRRDQIVVPSLVLDGLWDETFMSLRDGDRVVTPQLRFVVVSALLFDILYRQTDDRASGIVARDDRTVVVDEEIWLEEGPDLQLPEDLVVLTLSEQSPAPAAGSSLWDRDWTCPNVPCVVNPAPPGMVIWKTPTPLEDGFSVKPESLSNQLACPQLPSQAVDGVYRQGWGCTKVLKIPDSCDARLDSNQGSCCCSAGLMPLGYVCRWIDPTDNSEFPDWPDCYGLCLS